MARRGDGLYLRGKTWRLDFQHRGKRYQLRLGRNINRTSASEIAQVKRAAILKGEAGILRPPADLSIENARALFLDRHGSNLKANTRRRYKTSLRSLELGFPGQKLLALSPLALERYKRDRLAAGVQAAAVNRDLELLRNMCNKLVAWGKLGRNSVRLTAAGKQAEPGQVSRLKEPEGRTRFLSHEEEAALIGACTHARHRVAILLGIHAGLRIPSEALSLTWDDIDLKRRMLTVVGTHSKTSKTRAVPINATLLSALRELRGKQQSGPVFDIKGITTAFKTARRKAGLGADVTPHVMRHTFASRLGMAGVDVRTIQELGGWNDLAMVQRYSHLSPSHKAEAVEKIAENSPTVFTPPKRMAVDSHHVTVQNPWRGPVAQADRAEVS